ncbi:MAG TPA: hypothetical protein VFG73_02270 [Rhodanobacteraceae bacterium]|nr:hypothetical protein [Rhodanobacteraceae bacterium]
MALPSAVAFGVVDPRKKKPQALPAATVTPQLKGPGFRPAGNDPAARAMRSGPVPYLTTPTAYEAGQKLHQAVGQAASAAGGLSNAVGSTLTRPYATAVNTGGNFLRGLVGASQLTNPAASAAASPSGAKTMPASAAGTEAAGAAVAAASPGAQAAPRKPVLHPLTITSTEPTQGPNAPNVPGKLYRIGSHGEHVYSDGSGGIPATMTREQAQSGNLGGNVNVVSDKAFTGAPLLSETTADGGSTQAQGVAAARARLTRPDTGGGFAMSPQMQQQARLADVASGDWRSPLGTAASNLRTDIATGDPAERAAAAGQLAELTRGVNAVNAGQGAEALAGENNAATLRRQGLANTGAQQVASTQASGALAQQNAANAGAATVAKLRRPESLVPTRGGGLVSVRGGKATPVVGEDGTPIQGGTPKRTQAILDQMGKTTAKLIENAQSLSTDPLTPEQIAGFKETAARSIPGARLGTDKATGQRIVQINGQVFPL